MSVGEYYEKRDALDAWIDGKYHEIEQCLAKKGFHMCSGNVYPRPRHDALRDWRGWGRVIHVFLDDHELVVSLFSREHATLVQEIASVVLETSSPELHHIPAPLFSPLNPFAQNDYDRFWCELEPNLAGLGA